MKQFFLTTCLFVMTTQAVFSQKQMTDYEAIQNLIVSERLYRVSHRNAELAQCYAENAQIHTSWQQGGVASFVGQAPAEAQTAASLPNVNRCNPPLIHFPSCPSCANHEKKQGASCCAEMQSGCNKMKALVEYPSTTTRGVIVNGVEAMLTSYMRLVYRVEKQNGEWKITAMTSVNECDELAPVVPGQDLKIKAKDIKDLRPSYRWLAYTRMKAGGAVNNDELGTDRPEELNKFYEQEYKWLNEKEQLSMEKKDMIITVGNYQIAASETGCGPDMVILHGRNYSREMVQGIVDHYKDRFHIITYDALGHGQSSKPADFTLTDQSDVLTALVAHFHLQKPVVIGFSMGSYITLLTAERHPDLFSRIVLIGTRGQSETTSSTSIFAPQTTMEQILAFDKAIASPVKLTEEDKVPIGRSLQEFDFLRDAHKVTIPALVLTGHYDGLNTPQEGRRVAEALPNAAFHEIPDAGHIAFFENPTRVFELMDAFIPKK